MSESTTITLDGAKLFGVSQALRVSGTKQSADLHTKAGEAPNQPALELHSKAGESIDETLKNLHSKAGEQLDG